MTGLGRLEAFLRRHRKVALDTNMFIYELEGNPRYLPFTRHIFRWVERTPHSAVTSTLTMTEVLTQPYATMDAQAVNLYYGRLVHYPNLEWVATDLEIADLAAQFRARFGLRTPDAIHAATAVRSGVRGFISNDPVFERIEELDALVLKELL